MKSVNKIAKVLLVVVCCLAIASIGFVNATPRPLKQVNLLYATAAADVGEYPTVPTSTWTPVAGNQVSDFKLTLDGSATTWYFLNIKFIKPLTPVEDGDYPFKLVGAPEGYIEWVEANAPAILDIANGVDPMFYLRVSDDGTSFMLVDGFQYDASSGTVANNVRLQGNYFPGTYTFEYNLVDLEDKPTISVMFR